MKDTTKFFGIIIVIMVIVGAMGSCISQSTGFAKPTDIFDESVSEEEQAQLVIRSINGHFRVFEFSGRPVKYDSVGNIPKIVNVPNGIHTIKFDYYFEGGDMFHSKNFKNNILTANFEAGKRYRLMEKRNALGTKISFHIHDISANKDIEIKQ